jgi:actin-related protein 5
MSELLFEAYQVPSVTYGIDSLFSLYANGPERSRDGIVVSAGHQFSHVIPVLDGKVHLEHVKRYGCLIRNCVTIKRFQHWANVSIVHS